MQSEIGSESVASACLALLRLVFLYHITFCSHLSHKRTTDIVHVICVDFTLGRFLRCMDAILQSRLLAGELGKVRKVEVFMAADTWGAAATEESKMDLLLYADALQVHVLLRNGAEFAAVSQLDHSP